MLRALSSDADPIERRFRPVLRRLGWDAARIRAFLAITPAAAARLGSLGDFVEQVDFHGRRLAKLNANPRQVVSALDQFGRLLDSTFKGRFAPAREQLQIATRLALNHAFYQVREAESQAFFGLYHAAIEAADLNDLLQRMVKVLVEAFGAAAGWVFLMDEAVPGHLTRPHYIEKRGVYRSYWSYPFGRSAVLQFAFSSRHPWLPRERAFLEAAAERCQEALDGARMEDQIRRLEAESRRAEEEERRRIGRELHDEAGQSLMSLRLQLEMMERDAPASLRPRLKAARELAGNTAVELRRIVASLSPAVLERLGLQAALRQLAARFQKTHGTCVVLRLAPGEVPVSAAEVIYRVAQESLHNISRHSGATHVNLHLRTADKRVRLSVVDNGAGFCADQVKGKPKSFGLAGMRERAALLGGTLGIESAPGKGCRITLELPRAAAPVVTHGKDSRSIN